MYSYPARRVVIARAPFVPVRSALRPAEGERTAFAGYQRRRDELSGALFTVTDRIASYEWDTTRLRDLLLALSKAQRAENETLAALDAVPWAA